MAIGSYHLFLVILSIIISIFGSFSAFDLYMRGVSSRHSFRGMWLISSSLVLGLGIWCMHFTGTLAYEPFSHLQLNELYVLGSFLIGVVGAFLTLYLYGRSGKVLLSSLVMTLTIIGMHFMGMMAFQMNETMLTKIPMILAAVVGFLGSYVSFLWGKTLTLKQTHPLFLKIKCGVVMGISISGYHYLSMLSMGASPEVSMAGRPIYFFMDTKMLAFGVGMATMIILFLVLFGSYIIERIAVQNLKLETHEQYYKSLHDQNPDLVITFDIDGNFLSVNRIVELYGYTERELLHRPFSPYIAPDQLEHTLNHFEKAKQGEPVNYDTTILSKEGHRFEVNVSNFPIVVNKQTVGVYAVLKDISEFKKAQTELAEAEAKYRNLAENSVVGTYITQDGKFVYANQKLIKLLGYQEEDVIGSNVLDYIHPDDHPLILKNVEKRRYDISSTSLYQYRMIKRDHSFLYVENYGSAMMFHGKPAAIGTIVDISARKKAEETIEYMAYHDSLTGLFNRNYFCSRLKAAIADEKVENLALFYIDLDDYKLIDDALGHEVGDQLLKAVSDRLKQCVQNTGVMGRNRGDEFLIYFPNFMKDEAASVAERMILSLTDPFLIDQYEIYVTPSIGISLYPADTEDKVELIKKAEMAMEQAKKGGKNSYQFSKLNQLEHSHERWELEMGLRKALDHEEFHLFYQPKIDLTLGKLKGVEALLRWNHPTKGVVSPAEFIPMAEEMGLIIPIGEWVLRTACAQTKAWQDKGLPPFEVSVNLSVRQLYQPNLVESVKQVLEETGLDPKYLELEITESMMADSDHALKVLHDLKKLGLKISLDDFGTGFSSLHYLKEAPIDKLKIDQSFIRHSHTEQNDATIVKTIIAMAHQLNLEVVAEGVETVEHLIFLQQNLCDQAQGYLFSKPLPPEAFVQQFGEMEKIVSQYGVPKNLHNRKWMEKALEIARQELLETIRLQQGMTFKFIQEEGKFIHTLCEGELTFRLGLVPELIIGRELKNFQPNDEAERKTRYYRRAWEGDLNVSYEGEMNGVFYLASLRPIIRGGEVVEVIGSCIDITEQKKVEEALRSSESHYRLIADNMSDMVEVWGTDGLVKYASPSHERILGHPHKSFEGRSAFSRVHPEDRAIIENDFFQTYTTSEEPFQIEFRCQTIWGEWVYVEVQGTPVIGVNGEIEHFVVVGRDISERKRIDEAIRKSDKLSIAGQLAAGVAHEIRNPLTTIKGFIQIMVKDKVTPHYTNLMLSEIDHIEDIIKEFLTLAKPQNNKKAQLDVINLLDNVVTLLESQAILNNVEIVQEHHSDIPFILCDRNQIKQVFVNILQNAVEAMPTGGEITIQTMKSSEDKLLISFKDQGCGIPEYRLKNIGEPFYSTKEKGTGLGLMISYKIIQEHGGDIRIKSTVNNGTSVEVYLPITQAVMSCPDTMSYK